MKPVPEYIKVRSYIYNLVFKSDGGNVRIPSENELCELFSVSRVTGPRAHSRRLWTTGILVTRRGHGHLCQPQVYCRILLSAEDHRDNTRKR